MTDTYVQVQPDSTGKKIRTNELTVGVDVVEQQVVELADDAGEPLATAPGDAIGSTKGIMPQVLVGDTPPGDYVDGELRPLSMTNDGRLRVATYPARTGVSFTDPDQASMWGQGPNMSHDGSPFASW